jgi:hypothetical protein
VPSSIRSGRTVVRNSFCVNSTVATSTADHANPASILLSIVDEDACGGFVVLALPGAESRQSRTRVKEAARGWLDGRYASGMIGEQ